MFGREGGADVLIMKWLLHPARINREDFWPVWTDGKYFTVCCLVFMDSKSTGQMRACWAPPHQPHPLQDSTCANTSRNQTGPETRREAKGQRVMDGGGTLSEGGRELYCEV